MAKLEDYAIKLWDIEGGFVNHPKDPGGATNHGITLQTFKEFYPGATVDELRNLTYGQFLTITRVKYWNKWHADLITNQSIAEFLVDWIFNSGTWGIRIPQRILKVEQDGIVGKDTINAVNSMDGGILFTHLKTARRQFFLDIIKKNPSQKVFRDGWMNRIDKFNYVK